MNLASPEPAQVYLQLRNRIFSLNPTEVGLSPSDHTQQVWGVIMEKGYDVGFATLVSLADGTTSLYYSTGGGLIGSSIYNPLAGASKALVAEAENHLDQLHLTTVFTLPDIGKVRFYLLTYRGILTAEIGEIELSTGDYALSPLYQHAQETLAQLHVFSEKKR